MPSVQWLLWSRNAPENLLNIFPELSSLLKWLILQAKGPSGLQLLSCGRAPRSCSPLWRLTGHVASPGADGDPSGKSLLGSSPALTGMCTTGTLQPQLLAEVLAAGGVTEWAGVGGRCQFSPSAMQDHVTCACRLAGNSFPWGLAQLLASAPAPLCSQAPKPLSVPQRGECEMSSYRSLWELHTSKWVKAAAKNISAMFIFSVFPG